MDIFVEELLETLKETAIALPLLYLSFLLVAYFSHNRSGKYSKILHHSKKAGPLVGAFLGCVPQCGFSSVMSNLYSHKIVTIGTLFAVFISTSDEAIVSMLEKPQYIPHLLILMAIKLVYAIIIGYGIDLTVKLFQRKKQKVVVQELKHDEGTFVDEHGHTHEHNCTCENHEHDEDFMNGGCKHEHVHSDCCATNIFLDALKHTAILTAYIFVVSLVVGLVVRYVGIEQIQNIFPQNVYIQILIACAIGLMPNCAFSVLLVGLYADGIIAFAPLVAGLCCAAGSGLIVLFSTNRKQIWKCLLIVAGLFVSAFVCGILTSFIPIPRQFV